MDMTSPPPRSGAPISAWSKVSLALLPLAIAFFVLPAFLLYGPMEGDPAGLVNLMIVACCWFAAGLCVLVGFVSGWVGVRRYRGDGELPRTAWALHSAICVLGLGSALLYAAAVILRG
jgi:hypothetical protein